MQLGSYFLTSAAIAGVAMLSEAAEVAPTATADRTAPQIALSVVDFKATIIITSSRELVGARPNVSTIDRPALMVHAYDSGLLAASRGMRGQGAYTPPRGKGRGIAAEISEAVLICSFGCRLSPSSCFLS